MDFKEYHETFEAQNKIAIVQGKKSNKSLIYAFVAYLIWAITCWQSDHVYVFLLEFFVVVLFMLNMIYEVYKFGKEVRVLTEINKRFHNKC